MKHARSPEATPPASNTIEPIDRVLRRPAVLSALGISNSTLHAWIKKGHFPAPLELGPRVRGWRKSTVDAFLNACTSAPTAQEQMATSSPNAK